MQAPLPVVPRRTVMHMHTPNPLARLADSGVSSPLIGPPVPSSATAIVKQLEPTRKSQRGQTSFRITSRNFAQATLNCRNEVRNSLAATTAQKLLQFGKGFY